MKALVVTGTHSGCGKTTIALGIMSALKAKGLEVQPFKCGPDFIDSGHHKAVTGKASRNLDLWMCGEDYVKNCFFYHSKKTDISVVEGVMGLYDGKYSTSALAKLLKLPIILVVDAYGLAESAGAIIKGYKDWADESLIDLKGVIFNRVGSERHFLRLKNSIKSKIKVLGFLPRDLDFSIPHRHLGLMVAEETPLKFYNLNKLIETVNRNLDIDALLSLSEIKVLESYHQKYSTDNFFSEEIQQPKKSKRIAFAYDKAFCFYYEDNLDMLRRASAELIPFSPIADSSLPENIDGIYIGGGYPEIYAKALLENKKLLKEIKEWGHSGMPLYAECGGLMYLSKGIYDHNGIFYEMVGLLPFQTIMRFNRSPFLGYREVTLKDDTFIGSKGNILRGHEFHYSEIEDLDKNSKIRRIYAVKDSNGNILEDEGFSYKRTIASYIHLHFGSNQGIAKNFIKY